MTMLLRRRVVSAILVAMLTLSIASQVLPHVPGFGGVAYADECGGSSC